MNGRINGQTDACPRSNVSLQLLKSWGHINDFSTFCIGMQICHKKVTCNLKIIICTNSVDLESLYTKIQPEGVLGSREEYYKYFLPYMDMVTFLFNGANQIYIYIYIYIERERERERERESPGGQGQLIPKVYF